MASSLWSSRCSLRSLGEVGSISSENPKSMIKILCCPSSVDLEVVGGVDIDVDVGRCWSSTIRMFSARISP